jgi:deoxyribonuclease I
MHNTLPFILTILFHSNQSFAYSSKKLFQVHENNPYTLYCGCKYEKRTVDIKSCGYVVHQNAKRAAQMEWEHVVPAHAFGQSFIEWREGAAKCIKKGKKFKGRRCALRNQKFKTMESDLYNIYPEIGELNHLRQNFSMTAFGTDNKRAGSITFGKCQAIIHDRKFEPMDRAKGIVARIYKYMDQTYPGHGIISKKNEKLFEAWDKMFPVTEGECIRASRIEAIQGNPNPVLKQACAIGSFYQKK